MKASSNCEIRGLYIKEWISDFGCEGVSCKVLKSSTVAPMGPLLGKLEKLGMDNSGGMGAHGNRLT